MGFRFRKAIKIAPGIHMNIGKNGIASLTIGKTNFGTRGVFQTFNLPGTGLSYRAQLLDFSGKGSENGGAGSGGGELPQGLTLQDDGTISIADPAGGIEPEAKVRDILKENREAVVVWLEGKAGEFNGAIDALLKIHLTTPAPSGAIAINPRPDEGGSDPQVIKDWEEVEKGLKSDGEVMSAVLSNAFSSIEWPRETAVSFEIADNGSRVMLDVDLPEVEDMPTKEAKVDAKNLKLVYEDRSASQIQQDYLTHIHAIGFRLIGDVFAHLAAVETVVFSGYSQRFDKRTGNEINDYLYSVRVARGKWEQINFKNLDKIDVVACFEQFELRRQATKAGVITAIEPFG